MSELKTVSPLLDDFSLGQSFSSHYGVTCRPARHKRKIYFKTDFDPRVANSGRRAAFNRLLCGPGCRAGLL